MDIPNAQVDSEANEHTSHLVFSSKGLIFLLFSPRPAFESLVSIQRGGSDQAEPTLLMWPSPVAWAGYNMGTAQSFRMWLSFQPSVFYVVYRLQRNESEFVPNNLEIHNVKTLPTQSRQPQSLRIQKGWTPLKWGNANWRCGFILLPTEQEAGWFCAQGEASGFTVPTLEVGGTCTM